MATEPGRIISEVNIDLPYPRTLDVLNNPEFIAYEENITSLIGEIKLSQIK